MVRQNIKIDDDRYLITSNLNSNPNGWCSFCAFKSIRKDLFHFSHALCWINQKTISLGWKEAKKKSALILMGKITRTEKAEDWLSSKFIKRFQRVFWLNVWLCVCVSACVCLWGFEYILSQMQTGSSFKATDVILIYCSHLSRWSGNAWVKSHRSCVWIFSHSYFRTFQLVSYIKCAIQTPTLHSTQTHAHNRSHHYFIYPQD